MQKIAAKDMAQHKAHLQPSALANIAPDDLNLQMIWFISYLYISIKLVLDTNIFTFGKEAYGFKASFATNTRMVHSAKRCS